MRKPRTGERISNRPHAGLKGGKISPFRNSPLHTIVRVRERARARTRLCVFTRAHTHEHAHAGNKLCSALSYGAKCAFMAANCRHDAPMGANNKGKESRLPPQKIKKCVNRKNKIAKPLDKRKNK